MRTRGYALAAVLCTLACSEGAAPPRPPVPAGVELLYEGYAAGSPEIFRLDTAPAAAPVRLLPPGTMATDPTPSPDGSRIAFVVANYVDGTGDIFVVNRDGTGLRQLTTDPELDDSPAWSPDGRRLAFRSYRDGHDGEIWVMNADGTGATNLTPTTGTAIVDHRRPAWSPDGAAIALASTLGGDWGIWVMNADGSAPRQLTNTPELDAEPAWSPDGRSIAFRRSDASTGDSDILVVPAAGGEPVRLTLPGQQRQPAWSPDGQKIAFVGQLTVRDQPDVFVMRADGQDVRPVTNPAWGGATEPAWLVRR